jgi:hypothetical protein
MRMPRSGDFVKTPLGKGFIKERYRNGYLVQHGSCRFAFRHDEITVLQMREDRAKNGPLHSRKRRRAQG